MPSQNMLPKGHRHRSVRAEYVATRGVEPTGPPAIPVVDLDLYDPSGAAAHTITAPPEAAGLRLDQYLAQAIPEISRSRVQLLIEHGQVHVNGAAGRPKHKVAPGETIVITGSPRPAPLNATPEDIPLEIVVEDDFLAIVHKPAGMMVHAGAAAAADGPEEESEVGEEQPRRKLRPDPRSSGTLVNALLHHFNHLSEVGGELRPGIVHRLDKQTSGLLVVAKDDTTHRKLGEMFSAREVEKTYLALVHGHIARADTTVSLPIGRDIVRRTRMTTRRSLGSPGVRSAVSHLHVVERLTTPFGPFTLVEVGIETGRTHQIRVHLQALGHPVVGDTLYGAPRELRPAAASGIAARLGAPPSAASSSSRRSGSETTAGAPRANLSLPRNFLHAARLSLTHPRTGRPLTAEAPLPPELTAFLRALRGEAAATPIESTP